MRTFFKLIRVAAAILFVFGFLTFIVAPSAFAGPDRGNIKIFLQLEPLEGVNPQAAGYIVISHMNQPADNPALGGDAVTLTQWNIAVEGLNCMGNDRWPDGSGEWTVQAAYGLYVNDQRMLTFNTGCLLNFGYGPFSTVLAVWSENLDFDPFVDALVAEVRVENDDGLEGTQVLLSGEN